MSQKQLIGSFLWSGYKREARDQMSAPPYAKDDRVVDPGEVDVADTDPTDITEPPTNPTDPISHPTDPAGAPPPRRADVPIKLRRSKRVVWPREDAERTIRGRLETQLIGVMLTPEDVPAIALTAVRLAAADPTVPADQEVELASDLTWEIVARTWADTEALGPDGLRAVLVGVVTELRDVVAIHQSTEPRRDRPCCSLQ